MMEPEWTVAARRYMRHLSGVAIAVWLTLAEMTLGEGRTSVTISWGRLAQRVGMTRRSVPSVVQRLEARQLLAVDRSRRPASYRCTPWREWAWGEELEEAERVVLVELVGIGATARGVQLAQRLRAYVEERAPGTTPRDELGVEIWHRWILTCSRIARSHLVSTWDAMFTWIRTSPIEGRAVAEAGESADLVLAERAPVLAYYRARATRLGLV